MGFATFFPFRGVDDDGGVCSGGGGGGCLLLMMLFVKTLLGVHTLSLLLENK